MNRPSNLNNPSPTLADFFPVIDTEWLEPLDNQVFVQVKFTRLGGHVIYSPQSDKRAEQLASSIGKVIAVGKAAYKKKDGSGTPWADYNVNVGEYIIVPKGVGTNYIWFRHPEKLENNKNPQEILIVSMPDSNVKQKILDPLKAIESLADLKLGA